MEVFDEETVFFQKRFAFAQDSVGGRKQYFVVRQVRRRRMRFSGSRISFICGLVWCKASSLLCRELVFEEALRSVCPFASVCCSSVGISTSKRNAPSLQAPRAETWLTVYRALRSFRLLRSNFRKRSVLAFKLFPFALICAKGSHLRTRKVLRAIEKLYESSGGNQVDGLPPA